MSLTTPQNDWMTNPYRPPPERLPKRDRHPTKRNWLFVCGTALLTAAFAMPALGLIGTIIGMKQTFQEIDRAENMSVEEASRGISLAAKTTNLGVVACFVLGVTGLILLKMSKSRDGARTDADGST